jgi:hypothetical protein
MPSTVANAFDPSALAAANIHPATYLATDYLNHFNEAVMLLGLLGDMPDMVDEVTAWAPKSYPRHFLDTGFKGRDLAVAAYEAAPRAIRARFDATIADIDTVMLDAIAELKARPPELYGRVAEAAVAALHPLIERASAIINGTDDGHAHDVEAEPATQAAIDALLAA